MIATPPDFALKYSWCEGTVPPPHYYEFSICLGPDSTGVINFFPDYPQHDPPVWVEHIEISAQAGRKLYQRMVASDLFRQTWTEILDAPVGGSLEWLDMTADQVEYRIPSMIEESSDVAEIYQTIRSLVPAGIWKKLISQREDFIRDYPDE